MTMFDDHNEEMNPNPEPNRDGDCPVCVPANIGEPARLWHDVMVTTRGEVLEEKEGHDASLVGQAIERACRCYGEGFRSDATGYFPSMTPDLYAAQHGEQVVWDHLRVVAILRPLVDGTLEVVRL